MKRWIVPLVCALAGHLLLFTCDPGRSGPTLQPPARRSVTISLLSPPPAPERTVAPLAAKAPPAIKPMHKIAPPPPPKPAPLTDPAPPPVKAPRPKPPTPAEPPVVPAEPLATPPPDSSDEAAAPTDHATTTAEETETATATEEVEPSQPASDAAEVQASVPLYHLNPPPDYPTLARRRHYEGTVLLNVRVDMEGNAAEVQIARSSGHAVLDRSAVAAVERWRFEPARRLGRPVEMWVQVPVRFALK